MHLASRLDPTVTPTVFDDLNVGDWAEMSDIVFEQVIFKTVQGSLEPGDTGFGLIVLSDGSYIVMDAGNGIGRASIRVLTGITKLLI